MKLYQITIPQLSAPERADKLLPRLLPELPVWQLREAFAKRDVRCKDVRIAKETLLQTGDAVRIYTKHAPLSIDCIYQDDAYVIVNKMQGMEVQGIGSVESVLARQLGFEVFACHRLDVQTGGLLLLAKNKQALEKAQKAFADRLVGRVYHAMVCGTPLPAEASCRAFLQKDAAAATVRISAHQRPGALPIQTKYRVLEPGEISRVEAELCTGRTHQIRAHFAYLGHPVLGDDKYGNRAINHQYGVRKQMLWCVRLTLWDGRSFCTDAPF